MSAVSREVRRRCRVLPSKIIAPITLPMNGRYQNATQEIIDGTQQIRFSEGTAARSNAGPRGLMPSRPRHVRVGPPRLHSPCRQTAVVESGPALDCIVPRRRPANSTLKRRLLGLQVGAGVDF